MIFGTDVTLNTDVLWMIGVLFAFLLGHILGVAAAVRSRQREHNLHVD